MSLRNSIFIAASVAVLATTSSVAQAQNMSIGKREFVDNCALCHGQNGKGHGYFSLALKKNATDLTILSKNNKGVFPVSRLYQVIDGREIIVSHGSREMPVWGKQFRAEGAQKWIGPMATGYTAADAEVLVRVRILALIEYISTIQEK